MIAKHLDDENNILIETHALKQKLQEYEIRMGIGENDPTKNAYFVYVDLLRQQTTYLQNFKIKDSINSEDKGKSNEYERAKALWEGLPKMIQSVGSLRVELKMEGEEKKNIIKPISAKEIANGNV